jgi:alpha-2-macroglobulin
MFKYNLRRQIYYRTSDRNLNKGYVVFNKPKYLPNDTVKFKALILTKKKKYFKGAVTVKLESVYNENEKRILKMLKPESPGAYVYQFALGDTLKLNKRYSISLYDTKSNKKLIESESFELEDYQLNEAKYQARTDKDLYSKGEPIVIYASGKDANGFNILDGRVDINATIKSVDKYIADKVFIPNLFWSANEKLDPLGETKLNIPASLFPYADFDLKIDLTFNNSNNETHDTTFTIRYMETGEKLEVKLDSGYVKADYLLNGKSTPIKCKIIKRVAFQDITDSIQLPYKERINSNVHQYKFFVKNFSEEALNYRDEYLTNVYGFRTKDSVFINTNNPCNLDIAYSIYKDQKEIEKGIAKTIHKVLQDKSNANYYVYYNYIWQAETYSFTKSIQHYNKTLNINQPKQVYPGQKTQVKINVTDYEDEPVENVNVTAYAINSQFKHADLPEIPYLGKFHFKNFRTSNYAFEGKIHDAGSLPLNEKWRQKFGTDTMPYYNMLYPKNGMHNNFDSVKTINAQVSPFLVDKGNQVPICIVYIDDLPVYYCNTSNSENYVFITSPGYHQIRLRTIDKEYHLDSVLLKKGLKLDLSVDVNQLPKNCYKVPVGDTLSLEEKRNIRNTIVSIFDDTEGLNYLWQQNHVVTFNESGNRYRYSQLNNFGGFFPGKINYAVQNKLVQTFTFEPGYDYTIRDGVIKMVSNDFLKSQITLRPNENCYHQMGLKALPISSIKLKNSANWHLNFITPNPKINQVGKGTFKVEYTGDSTICLIQLIKYGNDSTVKYFDLNYNSTVYDLEPGYYRLTFITPSKHYFKKDSIHILPDGTSFERFNDLATTQSFSIYNIQTCKKDSVVSKWHSLEEISMFNSYSYVSSDGTGAIKVSLRDNETKEAIPFANVVAYRNGIQVSVATTNIDGEALIKPLNPGRYSVKAFYVGYQTREVTSIPVNNGVAYVTIELTSGGKLDEVQCVSYQMPLIDPDVKTGNTISREDYQNLAVKGIGDALATSGSIYQADNRNGLNVRGGHGGEATYFVDGIKVYGSPHLPNQSLPEENKIRKDYADYAYWQPNLITNKNGEVTFNVTFPDNVTKWNSYAIGMDNKKHLGVGHKETKAYKTTMANLAAPRFLIQGDSTLIIRKVLNYKSNRVQIKTNFKLNNQIISSRDTLIENSLIEKIPVSCPMKSDSLDLIYSLAMEDGARDGEQRKIPVFPVGLEETEGMFAVLNNDTSFTVNLNSKPTEVYFQNSPIDFMLEELENLKNYPYWCMEQTASKLSALLMEEKIKNYIHKDFKGERETKKLIGKLEKGQKNNGSWGWWSDSPENLWMTSYILRILGQAKQMGYTVKNVEKAKDFLSWNLGRIKGNELLSALNTLSELKIKTNGKIQ